MFDYFDDLFTFAWAVLMNWSNIATGGLIVALVWFWSTLKERPVTRRVGIGLAVLFLLLSFFVAWRTEYRRRLSLESMSLSGELDTILATAPAGEHQESSVVTVGGVVRNSTGPPTVADLWKVEIRFQGNSTVAGEAIGLNRGDTIISDDFGANIVLPVDQYWPDSGVVSPIPTGGVRRGWITSLFKNIPKSKIIAEKATVTVSFCDAKGTRYYMSRKVTGKPHRFNTPQSLQPFRKPQNQ